MGKLHSMECIGPTVLSGGLHAKLYHSCITEIYITGVCLGRYGWNNIR